MRTLPRTARSLIVAAVLTAVPMIGLAAPARADAVCSDCVNPGVTTPAGVVTVTTTPDNVVTVHLEPTMANTFVLGLSIQYPPGPPILPGYLRTTIATASAGTVSVDTIVYPPGPPIRANLPNIAIITIHPPSPCRAHTIGSTVTFTPITARA
jgi:hypothetical protein